MKRLDFPLRPHLLKYLEVILDLVHIRDGELRHDDYVLSTTNRFGLGLSYLLRKPVRSARHEASVDDCTAHLGVNLRNFPYPYYDLTQGKLSPWAVFKFNELVEDAFRADLHKWVGDQVSRGTTQKEGILSFMVFFGVSEDEVAFETLRKDVQRNASLPALRPKKNAARGENFSMNLSRKNGDSSPKNGVLSRGPAVVSQRATWEAVLQQLSLLPPPLTEVNFAQRYDRAA